jgi:hypothetical protein
LAYQSEISIRTSLRFLTEAKPPNRQRTAGIIVGLIIVAILSLGFVAYASMNPHMVTITQQQFFTNTQNQFVTQTVTDVNTVTSVATVTTSAASTGVSTYTVNSVGGYIGSGYYNCGNYGCNPPSLGAYGTLCQSTGSNSTVTCSGYLSEPTDGCIQLAIPYTNPDLLESTAYYFYSLRNTPSNLPSPGSWITVTGQLGQGYTPGMNGASCPGNYIVVSSIS